MMYQNYSVVALICARGGSKGIPGKNIKDLAGRPLIGYTIKTAIDSGIFSKIIVSTDDEQIKEIAESCGAEVPFMRPTELASDSSPKIGAMIHATQWLINNGTQVDIVFDMDPTTPFRSTEDIKACVDLLIDSKDKGVDTVATTSISHLNPYFNMMECDASGFLQLVKKPTQQITRRQDAPEVLQLNGAGLIMWRDTLLIKKKIYTDYVLPYLIPPERAIMIDTKLEFAFAEFLVKNGTISIHSPEGSQ